MAPFTLAAVLGAAGIVYGDERLFRHEEFAMDQVFQLAHISRPVIAQERRRRVRVQLTWWNVIFLGVARDEFLG